MLTRLLLGSFQLASDEVHCWCARLDVSPKTSTRLYATLMPEERERSARFRYERDRRRFIVAHGVLRDLLARYLHTHPGRIRYVYNAFGKPALSPEFGRGFKFNLSHSGDLALVAVAASNVGVDLEYIRSHCEYAEIPRYFFSPAEVESLGALPDHLYAEAFVSCWTRKEAYLKGCGAGFAMPLNSFSVPVGPDHPIGPVDHVSSNVIAPSRRWWLHTLRPAPGYVGALAIEGGGWRLRQWRWRGY